MTKSKGTSKKSSKKGTTKNVNKKIDAVKSNTSNDLLKIFRVLFAVIVVLGVFYLLTVFIVGRDSSSSDELETGIQYEEILAGSSFGMKNNEYVVVYYDFSDSELTDITSAIYTYSYSGEYRLYSVDMSSGFNKKYATSEESNKSPEKAEDLLINGPTLIRFADGKVQEYIEGKEDIVTYLQ